MDPNIVTYLVMFTIIVGLTACVIYLSHRSDSFEDEADATFLENVTLMQENDKLKRKLELLDLVVQAKMDELTLDTTPTLVPKDPRSAMGYLEYTD